MVFLITGKFVFSAAKKSVKKSLIKFNSSSSSSPSGIKAAMKIPLTKALAVFRGVAISNVVLKAGKTLV